MSFSIHFGPLDLNKLVLHRTSCVEPVNVGFLLFFFFKVLKKDPSVDKENIATLFCGEAPGNVFMGKKTSTDFPPTWE